MVTEWMAQSRFPTAIIVDVRSMLFLFWDRQSFGRMRSQRPRRLRRSPPFLRVSFPEIRQQKGISNEARANAERLTWSRFRRVRYRLLYKDPVVRRMRSRVAIQHLWSSRQPGKPNKTSKESSISPMNCSGSHCTTSFTSVKKTAANSTLSARRF